MVFEPKRYTKEQKFAILDMLDHLMWVDEHLLEVNAHLDYEPFRFHNRMYRSLIWECLSPMEQKEYVEVKKDLFEVGE